MCGICGFVNDDLSQPAEISILKKMNSTMVYRGPDDEGYYVGNGAGLAMRRLSVIDVKGGHQPFLSEDGEVVSICNGELYNFKELRRNLISKGHVFHSSSDAEIIPHLYEDWKDMLPEKITGMFAIAVWCNKSKTLLLARDRMGKKPLYYTHQNGVFVFASELKAVISHPSVTKNISRKAVCKYVACEAVPAPDSIFENIHKLEPGNFLVLKDAKVTIKKYWDVPTFNEFKNVSERSAVAGFLELFKTAVEKRLVSDVPLGVFLSGGIDSSSVVAMMSKFMHPKDIKTFSIAFAERSFDESSYARIVANHFNTAHSERILGPNDLLKLIPKVSELLDEPMADASIIPTFALSNFTRESVTVALGGDGGDELFAGYPTFQADKVANCYDKLPAFLRNSIISKIVSRLPVSDDNISFDFKMKQFIKGTSADVPSRHMLWLGAFSPTEIADLMGNIAVANVFEDAARHYQNARSASSGNRLLYMYQKTYLAENILTKVDRATMWSSLEARAPLLDQDLVEYVSRLPYSLKLRGLNMKYLLKKAMAPVLPKEIVSRSKKGFGMPVAKWLKGPLKEMAFDLLAPGKISREGFFKPRSVLKLLEDHMAGKADNRKKLWTLIVFENWLAKFGTSTLL